MSAATEAAESRGRYRGLVRTPKGAPRRGGRVKGTPNKVNADIKDMVVQALSKAGGVNYLVKCAHKQPVAFLGLVGRVLPLQVHGAGADGGIPITFEWAPAQPQQAIEGVLVNLADEIKQVAIDTFDDEPVDAEDISAAEPAKSTT